MVRLVSRPRAVLAFLGAVALLAGYVSSGELTPGYAYSAGSYLAHGGTYSVLLAGVAVLLDRVSVRPGPRGLLTAMLAFLLLYPVAVGLLYYDQVLAAPPYSSTPVVLDGIVFERLGFTLAYAPLAAGYVTGAVAGSDSTAERWSAVGILFGGGGLVLAYAITVLRGGHPSFSLLIHLVLGVAGIAGGALLNLIARWEYRMWRAEPFQQQV